MSRPGFLLLLLATLIMIGGAAYAVMDADRDVAPPPRAVRALPQLTGKLGDLAWLRLSRGGMTADFSAIGGRWVVVEKGNYPAAPDRLRGLLHGLADLVLAEPKTRRPDLLQRLDLDDPKNGRSTLVTVEDRIGETVAELIVGARRRGLPGGEQDGVYVRRRGDNQAWLARGALDVSGGVDAWLDRHILDIPPSRIASVALTGADGATLTLKRGALGDFAVVDPPADAKFKPDALAAPASALADLELEDVRPAADTPVPQQAAAHAVFTTTDGLSVTLQLFTRDKLDRLSVVASGSGPSAAEAAKINAAGGQWSYVIAADRAKLLRTRLADLLAPPAKGS